jgi:hypothetical protein
VVIGASAGSVQADADLALKLTRMIEDGAERST